MHALDEDLNLLGTVLIKRSASDRLSLSVGRPAFGGVNVCFATYTALFKNARWVIYSIELPVAQTTTATCTVMQKRFDLHNYSADHDNFQHHYSHTDNYRYEQRDLHNNHPSHYNG